MKTIEVKLTIDATNSEQVAAFKNMLDAMGGSTELSDAPLKTKPVSKKPVAPVSKNDGLITSAPYPLKETAASQHTPKKVEEEEAKTSETEVDEEAPKLADLRAVQAGKVANHREALKAKLTELGAANLTSLAPEHYAAYLSFLESLK